MLRFAAITCFYILLFGLLSGCDKSPGIWIVTWDTQFPGIGPKEFRINGEPPKRNEGVAAHSWEWPGLQAGVYEVTYDLHGVEVRTVIETHMAGVNVFLDLDGSVEPDQIGGYYTVIEPMSPVSETGYATGEETVRVWLDNGYYGQNRVTNVTIGGFRANRAELGPPQMMYWDGLPLGRHDLKYEYEGQIYSGVVEIRQRGAMFGIVDGGVVVVDERFGDMPSRRG